MNAGERAIVKEERRLEKERKRRIELANRMLIPVGGKTLESIGLIAIDPSGVFRFMGNRWLKIYEISGVNEKLVDAIADVSGRVRITFYISENGRETCHLTLIEQGEVYEEVRQKLTEDESVIQKVCSMHPLSVDEAMNHIASNFYKDIRFSYASFVRGKKDWKKECFLEVREDVTGFETGRIFGESLSILHFPMEMKEGLLKDLKSLGCPLYFAVDMNSLTEEEQEDFRRALEKKYNRRLMTTETEDYINQSLSIILLCDSKDARKIVEETLISIFLKYGANCTSFITVANELLDISGFKQEIARKYMSVGMKIENEKQRNRNNNDYLADASTKLLNEKDKLDAFSKALDTDDDHYFNSTMLIFIQAKDDAELAQIEEKLMNAASLKSIKLKSCFGKQRQALNSVLPLGIQEFKRVVNLSSSCLAMLMPFKTQELNDENGIYYGINQLSQNAIFADKKKLKNHNGLILGQSGSGKSVFAKSEIISTFTNYEEDQIIIIDPQSEYGSLAGVTDGTVISFDSSKEFYLNPMDVDFEGADYGRLQEIVAEKADFILTLLSSCLKRDILPEEQGVIDKVIDRVYSENYAMRKRLNGLGESTSEFEIPAYMRAETKGLLKATELSNEEQIRAYSPTLQDIYQGLKDYGNEIGTHLAAAMEIFVNGSLNLFNHRTNVDLSNRFIVFDLSGLKENLRVTSMLIMMETVRCAIKSNAAKGRWTHLYIDEFHELLAIEQVAGFVLRLWKEIRKMSGILNGITQNMSDLLNNENGGKLQAILSNTEYFALLSQSTLDKEKLMQFLPNISAAMFNFVDNADSGTGLIRMGPVTVPFDMRMSTECEIYKIVNTDGGGYGV